MSQVTPIGGAERQFQVIAHPDALRANNVSLTELLDAVARREPEHVGRHLHRRARRSTCSQADRPRAHAGGDRRDASWRCAATRSVLVRDVADVREGAALQARRRLAQRQAGGHRRRAEAARREHDRGDRAARSRARRAAAGAAGAA